jgi:hypothetical protein
MQLSSNQGVINVLIAGIRSVSRKRNETVSVLKTLKKIMPDEVTLGIDSSGPYAEGNWKKRRAAPKRIRATKPRRFTTPEMRRILRLINR